MQGHEHNKGMSKSKTTEASVRLGRNGYGTGRVRQCQAYRVLKMELRFEVRMENRKVMDAK